MKKILFTILSMAALGAAARPADLPIVTDTVPENVKSADTTLHGRVGTIIPGAILVTYGGLSLFVKPVRNVDYYVKGRIEQSAPNFNSRVDDYLQLTPGAAVYLLNVFGDEGKNRFWDRTALLALSGSILTLADGGKYLTHRLRPYGTDPKSFPSGHTGAAFLAAEFLTREYSWKSPWYGIVAYTVASTTGVLRLYNRAHWFSDCVEGAGLGILSTKAAYWLYPYIKSAFTHKDKHGRTSTFLPIYQDGAVGFSFAMEL